MYTEPGFLESASLRTKWNEEITAQYDRLKAAYGSRFFEIDPTAIHSTMAPAPVKWFGDPAEPNFCQNADVAQQLSDWGGVGRHNLHNEYCEYTVIYRNDKSGKKRPKRVNFSTELREYWVVAAVNDPTQLKAMAEEVLKRDVGWSELYGPGVTNPLALSEDERKKRFIGFVAGSGNAEQTPQQPQGAINTDDILFMSHPINGLDDLLYIVMFGARPYARQEQGALVKASREQIFRASDVEHLACRHADPAACMGAYDQVFAGNKIAFADPLGVYIQTFNDGAFSYKDAPIPSDWINKSRGTLVEKDGKKQSFFQRLEFGPPDDLEIYLDDIVDVSVGSSPKLTGGYQIARQIEVGPYVKIQALEVPISPAEFQILTTSTKPILCSNASVCVSIAAVKAAFEKRNFPNKVGPRSIG